MNKRQIIASLNKIANQLDIEGLHNEADTVTKVMSRLAMDGNDEYNMEDYGICPDCGEYLEDGKCFDCGYGDDDEYVDEDYDMGPESEPFDYNSPEDEGDMYGEADGSDYGDDF